jgi:hypothetical protein
MHLFNQLKKISANEIFTIFNSVDAGLEEGKYEGKGLFVFQI